MSICFFQQLVISPTIERTLESERINQGASVSNLLLHILPERLTNLRIQHEVSLEQLACQLNINPHASSFSVLVDHLHEPIRFHTIVGCVAYLLTQIPLE